MTLMTRCGSGVCVAAVETMLICVRAAGINPRPSGRAASNDALQKKIDRILAGERVCMLETDARAPSRTEAYAELIPTRPWNGLPTGSSLSVRWGCSCGGAIRSRSSTRPAASRSPDRRMDVISYRCPKCDLIPFDVMPRLGFANNQSILALFGYVRSRLFSTDWRCRQPMLFVS